MLAGLWHWTAGVFAHIGDVSAYWLVPALALKTCESALIALAWRNILDAAYPEAKVPFKTAWGASQGRNGDQRRHAGPGGHGDDDRHLPREHPGLVCLRSRGCSRRSDAGF